MSRDDQQLNERYSLNDTDDSLRYLVFSLSGEEYAMPLLDVKEVIGLSETTPIPYAPTYFKGVINLRGQIISVMDLRVKLGLKKIENGPETSIIILDFETTSLGVIVDSINCVLVFRPEDLSASPYNGNTSTVKESCIKSIAKKDKRLILNLDIEATLNIADRKTLEMKTQKLAA